MTDTRLEEILKQLEVHERRILALEKSMSPVGVIEEAEQKGKSPEKNVLLLIINKVGDCEESDAIHKKVLDKKGMEPKILLCFYISYKYFNNNWLTTGSVEKITSGLGVKIAVPNVSTKIKKGLHLYLEGGAVRKNGQPTPYRLNRNGGKRFEEILHAP